MSAQNIAGLLQLDANDNPIQSFSGALVAGQGILSSITVTLSNTPNTPTSIALPNTASGFRAFSRTADSVFAINENPAAVATSGSTTIYTTDFSVGSILKANLWETRLIPSGTSRTLRLASSGSLTVVDLSLF